MAIQALLGPELCEFRPFPSVSRGICGVEAVGMVNGMPFCFDHFFGSSPLDIPSLLQDRRKSIRRLYLLYSRQVLAVALALDWAALGRPDMVFTVKEMEKLQRQIDLFTRSDGEV